MSGLVLPQPGILALGTSAQTYLELDSTPYAEPRRAPPPEDD